MAYCVRADLEVLFGANNILKWADLDNDEDGDKITARITAAIVTEDAYIESFMRGGPYELPLADDEDAVPVLVRDISTRLAGANLYSTRGILDYDPNGEPVNRLQWHRKLAEKNLQRLKDRTLNLDDSEAAIQRTVPTVVKETTTVP